jgi:hypothetical protein
LPSKKSRTPTYRRAKSAVRPCSKPRHRTPRVASRLEAPVSGGDALPAAKLPDEALTLAWALADSRWRRKALRKGVLGLGLLEVRGL